LKRLLVALLWSFVVLLSASRSKADTKGDAARLKAAADTLMDEHKYADAYNLYVQAYDLSKDPALLYNQGRVLEALGEYPQALDKLEQFERDAPEKLRARAPGLRDLLVDLRSRITTVVVKTNVKNAQLQIRQKTIEATGNERTVRTRSGPAAIDVTAEGYEPFHRDIDLEGGKTVTVAADLIAKKRDALLLIRTRPVADISLDGKQMGPSPLEVRVEGGSHEVVARASGYIDDKVQLNVALGDKRSLDLELKKTPGLLSRWWFWTAVGVVVVGGATTAVLVTTERHGDHGTFQTGNVKGP
jgi:hypothetical protein